MPDVSALDRAIRGELRTRDAVQAALAARQYGVVARRQLTAAGVGRDAIDRGLAAGRLHAVHRGVYAVGHPLLSENGRLMAAVLAVGRDALLSHWSAARLWGLLRGTSGEIHVLTGGHGRPPGLEVHHCRSLDPADRCVRERVPVTSLHRTLLDVAAVARPDRLERAFEEAERLRLLDLRSLEDLMRRSQGHHGLKRLRAVTDEAQPLPPATRSELERRFLLLCDEHGLPRPSMGLFIAGLEVDAVWLEQRLVVELDGRAYHSHATAYERDRLRDTKLQRAGFRVVRITWRRLIDEPLAVVEDLRALLALMA